MRWPTEYWTCEHCQWRNCREDGPVCENCERDAQDEYAREEWYCLQSAPARPGEGVVLEPFNDEEREKAA